MLGGGAGLGLHHLSSPVTVGGPLHPFLQILFQACLRTLITLFHCSTPSAVNALTPP